MLATATAILKQFGSRCKIEHTDGSFTSAFGVVTQPSKSLIAGTSILEGSLVCWLQGNLKRQPEPGDFIKIGDTQYAVQSVTRVQPDGVLTYAYAAFVSV